MAVSNQIPFDVFVYDSEQSGLFVMYINVASYYSYIDMRAWEFSTPKLPSRTAIFFFVNGGRSLAERLCETSQCYSFSCAHDAPTC